MRGRNLRNLEVGGFVGRQASGSEAPAIDLQEVHGAFIRNCRAPEGTGTFLKTGRGCRQITLIGNDLARAGKIAISDPDVEPLEIYQSANRQ